METEELEFYLKMLNKIPLKNIIELVIIPVVGSVVDAGFLPLPDAGQTFEGLPHSS